MLENEYLPPANDELSIVAVQGVDPPEFSGLPLKKVVTYLSNINVTSRRGKEKPLGLLKVNLGSDESTVAKECVSSMGWNKTRR